MTETEHSTWSADAPPLQPMKTRRRILLVTDSLLNGGSERQFVLLAKGLPPEWDRRVWSLGDGPFREVLEEAGIRVTVRTRLFRRDVTPAFGVTREIAHWRPDIVQTWGWLATPAAAPACRLLRIPLVASIRFGGVPRHRRRAHLLTTHLADAAVANSQAGLDAFRFGPSRGFVVYNGFDPERLPTCDRTPRPPSDRFTVVMTARMAKEKDFDTFLTAARTLSAEEPGRWRFLAIGHGPDRDRLLRDNADLAEADVVEFPSAGMEVLPWVRASDCGVLLSRSAISPEGFANSITEYMACGLPVIASTGGGTDELVLDGRTGLVVPESDPDAVVVALRALRDAPEHAGELGEAGRKRVRDELTLERMIEGMTAVYEELLPRS